MNDTSKTAVAFDAAKYVGKLRALEATIAQIEQENEDKLKPYKDMALKLRASLLDFLNVTNQQNSKTINGTIYKSERSSCSIEDKTAFQNHVIGTEKWELLDWRANVTATKDYLNTNKELPPGVKLNSMIVLGVLAPRKKTTAPKQTPVDVESDGYIDETSAP